MPKNKKIRKPRSTPRLTELVVKSEMQEYALITRVLGSLRFIVLCASGNSKMAHLRGSMRKRAWVNTGDIVLISQRSYDEKVDILGKYSGDHVRLLYKMGELPDILIGGATARTEGAEAFVFEDSDSDSASACSAEEFVEPNDP
eukprot:TRINITY_DN3719_c0_g1_i1.p1 TRINITY_DN3719_c0_g1~~TRINITY_DN3719_c0_g1_i1.p1  ORF type:complete len:159 (-),score=21.80 TRINITY_DN3719_c0_g1_i1:276-707(-)